MTGNKGFSSTRGSVESWCQHIPDTDQNFTIVDAKDTSLVGLRFQRAVLTTDMSLKHVSNVGNPVEPCDKAWLFWLGSSQVGLNGWHSSLVSALAAYLAVKRSTTVTLSTGQSFSILVKPTRDMSMGSPWMISFLFQGKSSLSFKPSLSLGTSPSLFFLVMEIKLETHLLQFFRRLELNPSTGWQGLF